MKITLSEAIKFHGHLGPYLILGILAGRLGVKLLDCERYFGVDVRVWGADKKPKSCLIDGLQLSTGATYGKGNIHKFNGKRVRVVFSSPKNKKNVSLTLNNRLVKKLDSLKGHKDAEAFARELYNNKSQKDIFDLKTGD